MKLFTKRKVAPAPQDVLQATDEDNASKNNMSADSTSPVISVVTKKKKKTLSSKKVAPAPNHGATNTDTGSLLDGPRSLHADPKASAGTPVNGAVTIERDATIHEL